MLSYLISSHSYHFTPLHAVLSDYDSHPATVQSKSKSHYESSVHSQLVQRGRAWGAHINETWTILVYVGAYIIFSVGFDITICSLLGDAVLAIGENSTIVLNRRSCDGLLQRD